MVNQSASIQQSGAKQAPEVPDPNVSLLHFLCNQHQQLNRELDRLERLLVDRGETIPMMSEISTHKRDEQEIWGLEQAIASQLSTVSRIVDGAHRRIASICRGDWDDDVPF
jgi:hypothetical protein